MGENIRRIWMRKIHLASAKIRMRRYALTSIRPYARLPSDPVSFFSIPLSHSRRNSSYAREILRGMKSRFLKRRIPSAAVLLQNEIFLYTRRRKRKLRNENFNNLFEMRRENIIFTLKIKIELLIIRLFDDVAAIYFLCDKLINVCAERQWEKILSLSLSAEIFCIYFKLFVIKRFSEIIASALAHSPSFFLSYYSCYVSSGSIFILAIFLSNYLLPTAQDRRYIKSKKANKILFICSCIAERSRLRTWWCFRFNYIMRLKTVHISSAALLL